MKVLTLNVGLLDLHVFGYSILKPAKWIEERYARLYDAILSVDPDIVFLQEIYTAQHKKLLAARLSGTYGYSAFSRKSGFSIIPPSLITFSKWPMRDLGFQRFYSAPKMEKLIDSKGFLLSLLLTPSGGLYLVNVHTTAGGLSHPEHPKVERIRDLQIEQLLAATQSLDAVLLAGDFNCGSVSLVNYRKLLDAGYSDAWTSSHPSDNGWTWEPTSILNIGGAHTAWGCPAQRVDLILLNAGATKTWKVTKIERVFTEPSVPIDTSLSVTLSDHYGVLVTLTPTMDLNPESSLASVDQS